MTEAPDISDDTAPSPAAEVPALVAAAPAQAEPLDEAHTPFPQAALLDAPAGSRPVSHGRASGGSMPSMGGIGGGMPSGARAATGDELGSGNGVASVLGRRFSSDSGETTDDSVANGGNGSNGSNGNGDSNGPGSNAGTSDGSNQGPGGNGGPTTAGGTGSTGDAARKGGGIASNGAADIVGEDQTTGGARSIPEPGSILVGLGAVAAIVRRSASAKASADKRR